METKNETRRELISESLLPITLEVELERHGEGQCSKNITVRCHHYELVDKYGDLYTFIVEFGRLRRVEKYSGVLSVIEAS